MFSVYCCGSNGKFQLGNGTDEDLNGLERVLQCEAAVKKIVCGGNHTLILLDNGELYISGDNSVGQCGLSGASHITSFRRFGDMSWKDCCAGYEYTVLVAEDDTLYSMGTGPKGELGLGEKVTRSPELQRIPSRFPSSVVEIQACLDHTVLLLDNGDLYGWGNGRSGKIGQPAESKIWTPRLIPCGMKVIKFDLGRDFTVISDGIRLALLGKDSFGVVGKIDHITGGFKDFKTMWSSLHIVDSSNKIMSIGNNSHGQMIPQGDTHFTQFAVGSEHGIVLQDNTIMTWGWGEHGNCGIKQKDSVMFDYFNKLHEFTDEHVVMIEGGCATTWAVTYTET